MRRAVIPAIDAPTNLEKLAHITLQLHALVRSEPDAAGDVLKELVIAIRSAARSVGLGDMHGWALPAVLSEAFEDAEIAADAVRVAARVVFQPTEER